MEKYNDLGNTQAFIEVWKTYSNLHNGDWVQWGNYPEDGEFVPKKDDREKAWKILQRAYERLAPFEQSIVNDYEARNWPLSNDEAWLESAYDICKEYHLQNEVMAMIEPKTKFQPEPMKASKMPQKGEIPTLEELLPNEIKDAKYGLDIFKWAVDKSWFTITSEGLRWNETKALYGLFVRDTVDALDLRLDNDRIDWKKFRFILNHKECVDRAREKVSKVKNGHEAEAEGWPDLINFIRNLSE